MASMYPPKKNTAFILVLVIRDADGDPVSGATALDSEVSIDGAGFSDCTNEATEIGSAGIYTLALTTGEMNGDYITVQTKTSSAGAKTAVNVMYTAARLADDHCFPTVSGRGLDVSAGGEAGVDWANVGGPTTAVDLSATTIATTQKVDVNTIKTNPVVNGGTITFPTNATVASTTNITAGTITTTTTATNVTTVNGLAAGVITATSIAADAITAAKVADGTIDSATFAAGAIDAAAIAADAIGSSELAATAVNEIRDAILSDSTAFAGASIAAIKAKTDNLPEGIKKNTALAKFEFFMADSADHVTGKTGLTVAGAVSIDGGAFGALTNTPATEVANGIYYIDLAQADLNGTMITLKFTSAGADATLITIKTCL